MADKHFQDGTDLIKKAALIFSVLIIQGCAVFEPSDQGKREILQENAEKNLKSSDLLEKQDIDEICTGDPSRFRYICWRYYEVGGEVWLYRWHGKRSSSVGYVLMKDGKPIATQKSAGSFYWNSDKGRKDLGYEIRKQQ